MTNLRPALLFAALALVRAGSLAAEQGPQTLESYNETVCTVNGEPISKRDVEDRIEPTIMAKLEAFRDRLKAEKRWNQKTEQQFDELYVPEFRRQLRQVVKEKLMLQEAKERNLEADKTEFKKRLDQKLQELRTRGLIGKNGYSQPEVSARVKEQMLLEEFQNVLVGPLDMPNRPDVEKYYAAHQDEFQRPTAVKLRMIRVDRYKTDAAGVRRSVENASAVAENLRREVAEMGHSFVDLAKEQTDDLEARPRGGLMVSPDGDEYQDVEGHRTLAAVVRRLKPGQISDVFTLNEQSWAFVLLEDRRPAGPQPLSSRLFQKILGQLVQDVAKRKEEEWFRKALKNSLILDGSPAPRKIPLRLFFPEDPTLAEESSGSAPVKAGNRR